MSLQSEIDTAIAAGSEIDRDPERSRTEYYPGA